MTSNRSPWPGVRAARKSLKLAFKWERVEYRFADTKAPWVRSIMDKWDADQDRLFVVLFPDKDTAMPEEQDDVFKGKFRVMEAGCDRQSARGNSKRSGFVVLRRHH